MLCYSNTNTQQVWTSHHCKCISRWVMLSMGGTWTECPGDRPLQTHYKHWWLQQLQAGIPIREPPSLSKIQEMKRVQTGLGEMIAYLQPLLRMNQQLPWLTSPSRIPLYVLSWIIHCSRVKSYFGEDLGFFGAKPLDIWGCPPVLQGFKWFLNHSRLMYDYCDVFCPSYPCQKHSGWTVEVRTGAVTWCFHS